jgi:hypothetical protein
MVKTNTKTPGAALSCIQITNIHLKLCENLSNRSFLIKFRVQQEYLNHLGSHLKMPSSGFYLIVGLNSKNTGKT